MPVLTVIANEPVDVTFTTCVPVVVKLVEVVVVQTVLKPEQVILPVPNAIVLVLLLLELNNPVLNVRLFRFNVPRVSVVVRAVSTVKLFVTS